ncbi:MAG: ABC transporter permease [Chloroflexi bacterium]|nr:ABC transporter permease [Chloroflexota bacterium]MDA1146128.1 ABC transporter permease [Chloroflexota bacterium]
MSPHTVGLIARLEFQAALRNWWLVLYAAIFTVLAGGVSYLSAGGLSGLEAGQFGRTAAALTNVVLLVVPLFGLIAGAISLAADRERGLLAYYLAQPISAAELFWGKYLGTAAALLVGLAVGFAAAALALARGGALDAIDLVWLIALSALLMLAAYSVGTLISVLSRRSAMALGVAVFAWVTLLFLGDLGLMATVVATRLDLRIVIGIALLNPAEAFKIASIDQVGSSLDALGPAGNYLVTNLGRGLRPLLLALLASWIVIPSLLAMLRFERDDAI